MPSERAGRRSAVRLALALVFMGALVFGPAGTLAWPRGWLWCALMGVGFVHLFGRIARAHPGLIERRQRVGAGTPAWDVALVGLMGVGWLVALVVAGLDVRGGRPPLPGWTLPLGVVAHLLGQALLTAAMVANAFFEATVRIQREEGHHVVDVGPYAVVRHPGYVAATLLAIAIALVLGSARALVPAGVAILSLVVRTALEDRFLRANLPGYADYARRVRWRWVPGVW